MPAIASALGARASLRPLGSRCRARPRYCRLGWVPSGVTPSIWRPIRFVRCSLLLVVEEKRVSGGRCAILSLTGQVEFGALFRS